MNQVVKHEPQEVQTPVSSAMTPMDMLNMAVERGADIETLEKLMALQERWEANQARKAFDSAVADAKAEIKPVSKNRTGHNQKRYADFAAYANEVDPIISKYGLSYRFRTMQDEKIHVTCILSHRDGHSEESPLSGPPDATGNKNAIQAIGSTLTYLQRYTLMQALGLAAADDDDGAEAGIGGKISQEQVKQILDLVVEVNADIAKFCAYLNVEAVPDIPAKRFGDAVAALEARRIKP